MKLHTFTLILSSPTVIDSSLEDALYRAGCDDAALGQRGAMLYLEFDRDAKSMLDAILSAIEDAHRVDGVRVARVEPDDLVSASEIANRVGRSRESVRLLVEGMRGPGGFPVPVAGAAAGRMRLWRWSEVADWLDSTGTAPGRREGASVIAAVNGALELLRYAGGNLKVILAALQKAS